MIWKRTLIYKIIICRIVLGRGFEPLKVYHLTRLKILRPKPLVEPSVCPLKTINVCLTNIWWTAEALLSIAHYSIKTFVLGTRLELVVSTVRVLCLTNLANPANLGNIFLRCATITLSLVIIYTSRGRQNRTTTDGSTCISKAAVSFLVLFLYVSLPNICKYTKNIFKTKIFNVKKT